ncbi:hypothetical protein HYU19_04635 [Candidatus Woesearchaeota archaeon]|nr:hypothetical protein [Candidatus Woesearchaeota archaeon]
MDSEEANQPFNLDESLLREYPEMQPLSGLPARDAPQDTWIVSAVYVNLRTVERCLPDIKARKPTISIEYHLTSVKKSLDTLAGTGRYDRFVAAERQKLDELTERACELIGNKVRTDSVYQ